MPGDLHFSAAAAGCEEIPAVPACRGAFFCVGLRTSRDPSQIGEVVRRSSGPTSDAASLAIEHNRRQEVDAPGVRQCNALLFPRLLLLAPHRPQGSRRTENENLPALPRPSPSAPTPQAPTPTTSRRGCQCSSPGSPPSMPLQGSISHTSPTLRWSTSRTSCRCPAALF